MSAEKYNLPASVISGGNPSPRNSGRPVTSNAAQYGRRSFSRFIAPLLSWCHKSPESPARAGRPASNLASLQWSQFSESAAESCVLCAVDCQDANRLRQLVGLLPVGRKVQLSVIRKILGGNFKSASDDLCLLMNQFRLPIRWTRQGILLTAPVQLCERCAQVGEQLRRTDQFQEWFKAALPDQISDLRRQRQRNHAGQPTATPGIGSALPP